MKNNSKKNFMDANYWPIIEGKYMHFDNNIQAPKAYVEQLHKRFHNNESPNKAAFELTDEDLNMGVNTVYSLGEGSYLNRVPTYKGSVVLPEITITPEESYIQDPLNGAKIKSYPQDPRLKRRLCYGGRLGF